jgi:hypothetical protein
MKEQRVSVYGKDAEGKRKRAFDWLVLNGQTYAESVNRDGQRIKTPVDIALDALEELRKQAG